MTVSPNVETRIFFKLAFDIVLDYSYVPLEILIRVERLGELGIIERVRRFFLFSVCH